MSEKEKGEKTMNLEKLGAKRNLFLGLIAGAVLFGITSTWSWNTPCQRTFNRDKIASDIMSWKNCEAAIEVLSSYTEEPPPSVNHLANRLAWLKLTTIGSVLGFIVCAGSALAVYRSQKNAEA